MSRVRNMVYTKDNGETSQRKVIVVAGHRENDLMYDVSNLTNSQLEYLVSTLEIVRDYREDAFIEFEDVSGVKMNSLWRSFKPGGISWEE